MDDLAQELPSPELLKAQFAERDGFMKALGAELVELGRGHSTVRMPVRPENLNFNGTCHGGAIFSLADCAFGVASNSYGELAAGIDVHMTYNAAARVGDILTATATEVSRSRKIAVYDVKVSSDKVDHISAFTGTVYIIGYKNFT
ncbi:MAG: hotdog fold thioesterase [Roseovarius sp.]|nr:hotdog fold thioesterase [Roseovarius sp.]